VWRALKHVCDVHRCVGLCRELDELKLEHKTLDRQLLDAVSQKLQLSQQLEAWQVCLSVCLSGNSSVVKTHSDASSSFQSGKWLGKHRPPACTCTGGQLGPCPVNWKKTCKNCSLGEICSKLTVLFCSLAVLDPRVGHTMDVLSPFISVVCHSDWLSWEVLYTYWCYTSWPCVVFLAPACTWRCSLHYFSPTPLFPHGVTIVW